MVAIPDSSSRGRPFVGAGLDVCAGSPFVQERLALFGKTVSLHTVQLYDFGVTDDGTLYYVMELLDGMDLETLINRFGPVPAERAIHLMQQVCASLDDAHQNGLVHRDIKPANVVVSRFGAAWDFVKVLDFGLVKLEGARQSDQSVRLTADGSAGGTPAFMAPEVALGDQTTDHRVDIYSLGCLAYLAGHRQAGVRRAGSHEGNVRPRPHPHPAAPAIVALRAADSARARGAYPRVPGEGSQETTAERGGFAVAAAGSSHRHTLDARARRTLVEPARAGGDGIAAGRGRAVVAGSATAAGDSAGAQLVATFSLSSGCSWGCARPRRDRVAP